MLKVIDKDYTRKLYYIEGWSIRKISKTLEHARSTIRKMLEDAEIPKYRMNQPRPYPIMDPYREVICQWLEKNQQAPHKQRHAATRIYHRLVDECGFTGGASTVRRFVAELKQTQPECMIPLAAAPGEQAQVDFGQAQVAIINHELVQVHPFCLRMKYSQVPFVIVFPTEKLEAFLEGHVQAFAYLGGVPKHVLYDNAKTQMVKILEGPFRKEHEKLSSLRAHYLFDTNFCRPAKGNEKGAVENLVGYVRRNALVPVPSFPSWEALNAYLLNWCEKKHHRQLEGWETEQATAAFVAGTSIHKCDLPACHSQHLRLGIL